MRSSYTVETGKAAFSFTFVRSMGVSLQISPDVCTQVWPKAWPNRGDVSGLDGI